MTSHTRKITWAARAQAWAKASAEEKARTAMQTIYRRAAILKHVQDKPKVTVIRAQGKPLFVFVSGGKFVSAFTWDRLLYKVVYGLWKDVKGTTLERRLP